MDCVLPPRPLARTKCVVCRPVWSPLGKAWVEESDNPENTLMGTTVGCPSALGQNVTMMGQLTTDPAARSPLSLRFRGPSPALTRPPSPTAPATSEKPASN